MSEKKIKKRNIANYTGGVETADGRKLYGMDAENYLKIKAKEDPLLERKIGEWIESVLEEKLENVEDLHTSLKSGVMLCRLMNKLRPGIVRHEFNPAEKDGKKLHAIGETANIQLYLRACARIGMPPSQLFDITDLHLRKNMPQVLSNLEGLSKYRAFEITEGEIKVTSTPTLAAPALSAKVKHWELDLAPNSFHVDELTDDEIYEELLETRKLLASANRKIEALKHEATCLREQLAQLSMDDDNLSDEGLFIEEKDDKRRDHSNQPSTLTHRHVTESASHASESDSLATPSTSQPSMLVPPTIEDIYKQNPNKRCQCIIL